MIKQFLGRLPRAKPIPKLSSANDDDDDDNNSLVPTTAATVDLATLLSLSASSDLPETLIPASLAMAASILFRPFPPRVIPSDGDDEDDAPFSDTLWPHHLLPLYDLLLRLIPNPNFTKRHVTHLFLLNLLSLSDSPDHRERDRLKTLIHRLYRKFPSHRLFLRTAITDIISRFIFETDGHNGIAELLEVLGSIINGYALPLKEEHKVFLVRTLLPLHKPAGLAAYHQQLAYCITQFVEKDAKLADTVVRGMLKFWPVTSTAKEVMFLGEMEEVLEAMQVDEFKKCMVPLFRQIGKCVNSSHFQVYCLGLLFLGIR